MIWRPSIAPKISIFLIMVLLTRPKQQCQIPSSNPYSMISNNMNFHPSNSHRLKSCEPMTMVGHVLWCTTICIQTISITSKFINYDHISTCKWLKVLICIIWSNWCYKTCPCAFANPTSSFFKSSLCLKRLFVGHSLAQCPCTPQWLQHVHFFNALFVLLILVVV